MFSMNFSSGLEPDISLKQNTEVRENSLTQLGHIALS